jgi:hypothetical protein
MVLAGIDIQKVLESNDSTSIVLAQAIASRVDSIRADHRQDLANRIGNVVAKLFGASG